MAEITEIHVIPSFHYDVAYQKTFREYLPQSFDNLRAALNLLEQHEDYTYCVEQVILLREYWRNYPEEQAKIKRFARHGRLFCAPGMFTMPDVNIPSGENFIRNALIGREWLRRNLGIEPDCCWMADIFGHHPQMPQLAVICGFKSYMFERGKCGSWNTTFSWKGIDGTTIPAHWEIDTYFGLGMALAWQQSRPHDWVENRARQEIIKQLEAHSPDSNVLLTTLGGDFLKPKDAHIQFIRDWNNNYKELKLKFSTPEAYFLALQDRNAVLKVEDNDLNPLCEGCYSSRIRLKQNNRRLEETAATLEVLECLEHRSHRSSEALWETLAWNAFHDILCGSLVKTATKEALQMYDKAAKRASISVDSALNRIIRKLLKTGGQSGVCYFNSLPYARKEIINTDGTFAEVAIPPMGWAFVSDRQTASKTGESDIMLVQEQRTLENDKIKITFGVNGTIVSLYDKENKQELAAGKRGMNNPLLTPDAGDLWMIDGNINSGLLRTGPFYNPMPVSGGNFTREGRTNQRGADADCFNWPEMIVIHNHPLQATVEFNYPEIGFKTQITLRKGEKLVRFRSIFMPTGKRYRLQVAFQTAIKAGRIRHSIPCGHLRRPEGEYAAQGWVDYADKSKGLLLVNKGLPGNNVTNSAMMLSLFRAISMDKVEKVPWYEEGVEHIFEYAIMPFSPKDKTYNPTRIATLFNREVCQIQVQKTNNVHNGVPLLELCGDGAELCCLRRERGGLVIRLWETRGKSSRIRLKLKHKFDSCFRTDATGAKKTPQIFQGNYINLSLKPFEIITLFVK